jgi:hypothetical protein
MSPEALLIALASVPAELKQLVRQVTSVVAQDSSQLASALQAGDALQAAV